MKAGSKRIHAIQAHYKRKWFYLGLYLGKGWLKKLIEMEAPSDGLLIVCAYSFIKQTF